MPGERLDGGTRRLGPTELLNDQEAHWSPRLRGLSLAVELDVPDRDAEKAIGTLGWLYAKRLDALLDPAPVFKQWPACLVVGMTAVAGRDFAHGAFWPAFWEAVGFPGEQEDQSLWGHAFIDALARLGLPTFPFMPTHFVGPILMHTGIPNYCLGDFLRLLVRRCAADPGLDAESLLAWATGNRNRLAGLDRPVRRFIEYGSDYALDVIDRSLEMLRRLQAGDELAGVGLPARLVAHAEELVADESLNLQPLKGRADRIGSSGSADRPRLRFDPFGRGVEVALPAVIDAADGVAAWGLTVDGSTTTHLSRAGWLDRSGVAPATRFPVARPARTVVVDGPAAVGRTELVVVDPRAPLLVFAEGGRILPRTVSLPPDVVWVVHPEEHALAVEGRPRVIAEGQLGPGWLGWRAQLLMLDAVRSLGLEDVPAARRQVRGFQRPRIVSGEPVPGLTTSAGEPVFGHLPRIVVPSGHGAEVTWTVEIRRSDELSIVTRTEVTTTDSVELPQAWAAVPRPVLGSYHIAVRGPLGRGTDEIVFIADQVGAKYSPPTRVFNTTGLVSGDAAITVPVGVSARPRQPAFTPAELSAPVEVSDGTRREQLVVTPPHVAVLRERARAAGAWTAGPLRLTAESFRDDPGSLLVRTPGAPDARSLEVLVGGQAVQELEPRRLSAGTCRYDLRRAADTVAEHGHADLVLPVMDARMPLIFVRPGRLATAVRHKGDRLVLGDAARVEGLAAAVYPIYAPWRSPAVHEVVEDSVPLPAELRSAGPLAVFLQIESPWTYTEWPPWPSEALVAAAPGHLRSDDEEETAVSAFLAGATGLPDDVRNLSRLWVAAGLAAVLRPAADVPGFLDDCGAPLRANPHRALRALIEAGPGPEEAIAAVVGTGVAEAPPPDHAAPAVQPADWSLLPVAAALLTGGCRSDEECRTAADDECGATLAVIRTGRRDPHAKVGRFGVEAEALARMPPEQLAVVWRVANAVPQTLLDPDSRMVAARRLFDQRLSRAARAASQSARPVVEAARQCLATRPDLVRQVNARFDPATPTGWQALPAMSIALALLARLAAHGDPTAADVARRLRGTWWQLTTIAPDLCTLDLIIAEFLIAIPEQESS